MKRRTKPRDKITLLDVLIDGFEKNEILYGYHWRELPVPDESAAISKFKQLVAEATRWQGPPTRTFERDGRRLAAWPELDIRQAGRGILIRVWSAWFGDWWHKPDVRDGEPLHEVYDWAYEELDKDKL